MNELTMQTTIERKERRIEKLVSDAGGAVNFSPFWVPVGKFDIAGLVEKDNKVYCSVSSDRDIELNECYVEADTDLTYIDYLDKLLENI